jgi:serine/threonine protein kinase
MEVNRLYIQTELCSCTLDDERNRRELSIDRRYKLLREILLALEFIHRNRMVHLDIKPENIFVKADQYKLGDFGLASVTQSNNDVEEGDSRYMSRELLAGNYKDLTKVSRYMA